MSVNVAPTYVKCVLQFSSAKSPWPRVTLEDGRVIETRLIVGADGANSAARAAANIRTMDFDFGQMGVVATVRLEQVGGGLVYEITRIVVLV